MFIAGSLTVSQEWKLTKCPSVDGWTNNMCSLHTMEYYSITKKDELLTSAVTWINLEHILLLFNPCHVWLCDPMDCSTPGFPVLHHLLERAQTHVHQVGDAIQPSHPLSSPSPPALNLSQHQGLYQ